MKRIKKLIRLIAYHSSLTELLSRGHDLKYILTFEQYDLYRFHVCTFVNKISPPNPKYVDKYYKCDNELCLTLKLK